MISLFRKKQLVLKNKVGRSSKPLNIFAYGKFFLGITIIICFLLIYANWTTILAYLDRGPIRAYALTHQTRFTTNSDIRTILAKEPKLQGYFSQDIQEIKARFLDIPWIKDVIVRKTYPDRISLTLFEHNPVAVWNNKFLLSQEGTIFQLPSERFDITGLPILYGPDLQAKNVLDAWYKIQKDLQSRNLTLKSVATDVRGAWTIMLGNGIELKLGRGDWLPKIDRFVTIFPHIDIPEGKNVAYVDLRYEHGASIGFHSQ